VRFGCLPVPKGDALQRGSFHGILMESGDSVADFEWISTPTKSRRPEIRESACLVRFSSIRHTSARSASRIKGELQ
jgi:hypothetical protein